MSSKKPRGLGKGLGALIPQKSEPAAPTADAPAAGLRVPIEEIHANPDQPRTHFDPIKLQELADSIREQGLLQPLLVRRRAAGGYELIAGERRLRASRLAGVREVPVTVRSASDKEVLELALVENLQRDDLNPVELAKGYESLLSDYEYTQEQLAKRVGRERSSVANALRLLKLPEKVQQDLIDGTLSTGHAKALLSLDDVAQVLALREEILKQGLSVRAVEERAQELMETGGRPKSTKSKKAAPLLDPDVVALVNRLERNLGVKIEISHSKGGKGKLTIHYTSLGELQPVLDKLES